MKMTILVLIFRLITFLGGVWAVVYLMKDNHYIFASFVLLAATLICLSVESHHTEKDEEKNEKEDEE